MATKEGIKQSKFKKQNGKCALSGADLIPDSKLIDAHRLKDKRHGGELSHQNASVVEPVAHMIKHGNLRIRTDKNIRLKQIVDEREHAIRIHLKINNQLLAYKRAVDHLDQRTVDFLQSQAESAENHRKLVDKDLSGLLKEMRDDDPLIRSAMELKGIGPVSVAYCIVYIDLEKARHASSLWSYTGLDKASHERYEKNVAGGGNKRLRTILYTMADSQVKGRERGAPYAVVYDRTKARLEKSEKVTKSRNTQGKLIECMWKDTKPSHRHGAALRAVMKHFLADYWYVGRSLMGLEVGPLYPEAVLGGSHRTIMPEERGWKY